MSDLNRHDNVITATQIECTQKFQALIESENAHLAIADNKLVVLKLVQVDRRVPTGPDVDTLKLQLLITEEPRRPAPCLGQRIAGTDMSLVSHARSPDTSDPTVSTDKH